jgi:hypothetical protein
MRIPEWLRLTLISLVIIAAQQMLLMLRPEWRTGLDLYVVWLLIVSAARGLTTGAVLAVLGGMLMDASSSFNMFHMLFYLLPVAVGALFTSHLITEYNLLASLITAGLLLLKLLLLLLVALCAGWLTSGSYLFGLNYFPLLCMCLLVFLLWQRLVRIVPPTRMIGVGGGFGR